MDFCLRLYRPSTSSHSKISSHSKALDDLTESSKSTIGAWPVFRFEDGVIGRVGVRISDAVRFGRNAETDFLLGVREADGRAAGTSGAFSVKGRADGAGAGAAAFEVETAALSPSPVECWITLRFITDITSGFWADTDTARLQITS